MRTDDAAADVARVEVLRVARGAPARDDDLLAVEEPLLIELAHDRDGGRVTGSVSVTMRTPGHDAELAVGFLYAEGILAGADELLGVPAEPAGDGRGANVVRVALRPGVPVDVRRLERHFYTASSCGVCGKTSLEALAAGRPIVLPPPAPLVGADALHALPSALRAAQAAFEATGGLHAAALFDADGRLLCVREDVGRHNAVDKVVGRQLLDGRLPLHDRVLLVSGRASFELVHKALAAGIPLLAAVGAPSSLAVETARAYGATLVGFVRDGRFNVYAGAARVRGLDAHLPER
ncbi:formate dehydrogenase accessory sulfurtransferase FdhD [Roseisolibacter sp. H3M3-2]|uniref:formate dehydrogenase accessory sulfurtransferase FdhD n=1 Tax=Roseisolibacter sp. H3M3-2 TaxID=3031323 RepID=UPI0023DA680D|nr:formate dehydrogenase accessory sulfurtransferase FdhD [Roseisolibacter sp. H3M3-2]MDF1502226.1 formate dehydrogenase accessory sulfurtransferase FdhD [Roseisolibacter sp. H3M3-2]